MRRLVAVAIGWVLALSVVGSGLASAAPGVVRTGECSGTAGWRLELTDVGVAGPIVVRFELHRSPGGHEWRIELIHRGGIAPSLHPLVYRGIKVASDSGNVAVQRRTGDTVGADVVVAKAEDTQTNQVCRASALV